jgi:hypothetical protein
VQIVQALRTARGAADAALCEQRMARHVSDALARLTDHSTTTGDKP